jgi:denticleless
MQNYSVDVTSDSEDPFLCLAVNDDRLVVASEKGCVRIVKTSTDYSFNLNVVNEWQAHYNAIFDIKWRPGFPDHVITGSADQSFSLWDLSTQSCFNGNAVTTQRSAHTSSIKCISFFDSNIFATGSRDGHVKIWDLRLSSSASSCVKMIKEAHPGPSTKGLTRKKIDKNAVIRSSPLKCVTSVLFLTNTMNLFTAGASETVIKLWDVRKLRSISAKPLIGRHANSDPTPVTTLSSTGNKSFSVAHGFSSLSMDSKSRIYAACSDHRVYAFDTKKTNDELVATFSANSYRTNNFTRIAIVNDYLVSGSVEGSVPVWSLRSLQNQCKNVKPIVTLNHHEEVTSVAGNDSTMEILTCSDDQKIHKWSLLGRYLDSKHLDPSSEARHRVSKPYVPNEVELEEIIVKTSTLCTSPSNKVETYTANESPMSGRPSTPQTSLSGWLTPNDTNTPSQISPSHLTRKRSLSKENLENGVSPNMTTPTSSNVVKRLTSSEPKAKKSRTSGKNKSLSTPQTKKISDYFSRS